MALPTTDDAILADTFGLDDSAPADPRQALIDDTFGPLEGDTFRTGGSPAPSIQLDPRVDYAGAGAAFGPLTPPKPAPSFTGLAGMPVGGTVPPGYVQHPRTGALAQIGTPEYDAILSLKAANAKAGAAMTPDLSPGTFEEAAALLINAAKQPGAVGSFVQGAAQSVGNPVAGFLNRQAANLGDLTGLMSPQTIEGLRGGADALSAELAQTQGTPAGMVGGLIGQGVPAAAAALVTRVPGVSAGVGAGIQGAALGTLGASAAESGMAQYEGAMRAAGKPISPLKSIGIGAAYGVTEIAFEKLGIDMTGEFAQAAFEGVAKAVLTGSVQNAARAVLEVAKAGGVNMAEEMATQIGQNLIDQATYDTQRRALDNVGEAGVAGALQGVMMGGAGAAAGIPSALGRPTRPGISDARTPTAPVQTPPQAPAPTPATVVEPVQPPQPQPSQGAGGEVSPVSAPGSPQIDPTAQATGASAEPSGVQPAQTAVENPTVQATQPPKVQRTPEEIVAFVQDKIRTKLGRPDTVLTMEAASTPIERGVSSLAERVGRSIVWVGGGETAGFEGGAIDGEHSKIVLSKGMSPKRTIAVAFHEIAHSVKQANPEAWSALREVLPDDLVRWGEQQYLEKFKERATPEAYDALVSNASDLENEGVSTLLEMAERDPKMRLMVESAKPGAIRRFVAAMREILDRVTGNAKDYLIVRKGIETMLKSLETRDTSDVIDEAFGPTPSRPVSAPQRADRPATANAASAAQSSEQGARGSSATSSPVPLGGEFARDPLQSSSAAGGNRVPPSGNSRTTPARAPNTQVQGSQSPTQSGSQTDRAGTVGQGTTQTTPRATSSPTVPTEPALAPELVAEEATRRAPRLSGEKPKAGTPFPDRGPMTAPAVKGKAATLRLSGGSSRPFVYEVIEAADLIPSHDPTAGFQFDPRGDSNERPYEDAKEGRDSRETVRNIARAMDPALLLTDTPSATDGPPIVESGYRALGGNARSMGLKLAYRENQDQAAKYRAELANRAGQFGLDPATIDAMKEPVLVRRLEGDPGKRGELSRILNASLTTGKTSTTEAVSRGQKLNAENLRSIANLIDDDTLHATLTDPYRAEKIARMFIDSGAFTPAELAGLYDDTSRTFTDAGESAVEGALLGGAFGDVRALSSLSPSHKSKLVRAIHSLAAMRAAFGKKKPGEGLNIQRHLSDAADAIADWRDAEKASGQGLAFGEFLKQTNMIPEAWRDNFDALLLAEALINKTQKQLAIDFATVAEAAELDAAGESAMFGDAAPDPVAEFRRVFAKDSPTGKKIAASQKIIDNLTKPGPEGDAFRLSVAKRGEPITDLFGRPLISRAGSQSFFEFQSVDDAERVAREWRDKAHNAPAFQRWFGKSVVRERDGAPQVWYHGTTRSGSGGEEFAEMIPSKGGLLGPGVYVTQEPRVAAMYAGIYTDPEGDLLNSEDNGFRSGARVLPFYIRAERPLGISDAISVWSQIYDDPKALEEFKRHLDSIEREFLRGGRQPTGEHVFLGLVKAEVKKIKLADRFATLRTRDPVGVARNVTAALSELGFDSVFYLHGPTDVDQHPAYVLFDANQVKSPFNRGSFDKTDRLLFSVSPDAKATDRVETDLFGRPIENTAGQRNLFTGKTETKTKEPNPGDPAKARRPGETDREYRARMFWQSEKQLSNTGMMFSVDRPYGNAPESLMGFRSNGKESTPYADQNYRFAQPVRVSWPDGTTIVDEVKGLNKPHALERARRNWDGATIEEASAEELKAFEERMRFSVNEARRGKPVRAIEFTSPIVGPTGAKLLGYEWAWKYDQVQREDGEMVDRRVSDWEESQANLSTGREIVHKFAVQKGDQISTVSLETALKAMGFLDETAAKPVRSLASSVKTLANRKMQLAAAEAEYAPSAQAWEKANSETMPAPRYEVQEPELKFMADQGKKALKLVTDGAELHIRYLEPGQSPPLRPDPNDVNLLRAQWQENRAVSMGGMRSYQNSRLRQKIEEHKLAIDKLEKRIGATEVTKSASTPDPMAEAHSRGMLFSINVDGVDRPTTNSDGNAIHPTEEGTRAFWKWFGDSKVVDEQGRPKLMYHGGSSPITAFDERHTGGAGFYFTPDYAEAENYARGASGSSPEYRKNITRVYLSAQNPASNDVVSVALDRASGGNPNAMANAALRRDGYDSRMRPDGVVSVFDPTQIKSATGNAGTFDPANPDIRFSIDVDGVQRPTLNSDGNPIHPTEDGTRAFWKWFGDSKTVDAEGRPQVLYHGTPSTDPITEFKANQGKIYFSDSRKVAEDYTAKRGMWRGPKTGYVAESMVRMSNPLVIEAGGKRHDNIPVPWQQWKPKVFGNLPKGAVSVEKAAEYAKANGYDGLIVRNVVDTADPTDAGKSNVFVAFDPSQIKSATDNTGSFDPTNPDIRFSIDSEAEKILGQGKIDRLAAKALRAGADASKKYGSRILARADAARQTAFIQKLLGTSPVTFSSERSQSRLPDPETGAMTMRDVETMTSTPTAGEILAGVEHTQGFVKPEGKAISEAMAAVLEAKIGRTYGEKIAGEVLNVFSRGGDARVTGISINPDLITPENNRNLLRFLEGNATLDTLPEGLRKPAEQARKTIDKLSEMLAEVGGISPKTLERYRGTYVPVRYYHHEAARFSRIGKAVSGLARKWKLTESIGKPRLSDKFTIIDRATGEPIGPDEMTPGWFSALERDTFLDTMIDREALREINRGRRLNNNQKPLEVADLYGPAMSALPAETQQAIQDVRTRIASKYEARDPLDEATLRAKGRIEDTAYLLMTAVAEAAQNIHTLRLYQKLADNPGGIVREDEPTGAERDLFERIPNGNRYGALSGKFVEKSVAAEVLNLGEPIGGVAQLYDNILRLWKKGKTVYNPATHARNLIGNVLFADLAGINPLNPANLTHFSKAIDILRGGGSAETLRELYRNGVLDPEHNENIKIYVEQLFKENKIPRGGILAWLQGLYRVPEGWIKPVDDFLTGAYQAEDSLYKVAAYLKARAQGATEKDAAQHVRRWFPYYDQLKAQYWIPPFGNTKISTIRRWVPFASFQIEATRIAFQAAQHKPATLAKWAVLPSLLTAMSAAMLGLDDDERDRVLEGMKPWGVLLPHRDSHGRLQYWDTSNAMPFAQPLGIRLEDRDPRDPSSNFVSGFAKFFLSQNPFISYAFVVGKNIDIQSGRVVVQSEMTPEEARNARLRHMAATFFPTLAGIDLVNALSDAPDGPRASVFAPTSVSPSSLEKRDLPGYYARRLVGVDLRSAEPTLYSMVREFQIKNGYQSTLPGDGDLNQAGRFARRAWYAIAANDPDRLAAVMREADARLPDGKEVRYTTLKGLRALIKGRDPLRAIKTEDRQRFIDGLDSLQRQAVERTQAEYEAIINERLDGIFEEAQRRLR